MDRQTGQGRYSTEWLRVRRASKRAWRARLSSLFLGPEDGKQIDLICEGQGEEHIWAIGKEGVVRCKRCGAECAETEADYVVRVPWWKRYWGQDEEAE